MYRRISEEKKKDIPISVIQEDEKQELDPQSETYNERMERRRKRLWNEMQTREKMTFSMWDIVKASFINLIGASRHISMLQRGIKKLHYDFDIVRVVRTLKNVNTAMQAFLSEPNKLYLRNSAINVVQTESEEERAMWDWNAEENYLDLSPDDEKDRKQVRSMVIFKITPPDFNAPLVGE